MMSIFTRIETPPDSAPGHPVREPATSPIPRHEPDPDPPPSERRD
jgi:hypothetical protein